MQDEAGRGQVVDEGPVHPLVQIKIEGVGRAVRIAKARLLDAARDRTVLAPLPSVGCQGAADWMLSFREIVFVVSERRPQDLSTRDSTPTSMLIVRFAMPASCRFRWNFAIRRGGDRRERDVAEVLLDEAEPFLFQLDRGTASAWHPGRRRSHPQAASALVRRLTAGGVQLLRRALVLGESPFVDSSCPGASRIDGRQR